MDTSQSTATSNEELARVVRYGTTWTLERSGSMLILESRHPRDNGGRPDRKFLYDAPQAGMWIHYHNLPTSFRGAMLRHFLPYRKRTA